MNRNFTSILALILVCLALGFLTDCGGSSSSTPPPPTIAITATSGSGQTATVGEVFTNKLVATVTSNGTAAGGVTVTFTPVAGSAGQSCTPSATTVATASDGTASITCTANAAPGGYSVTAAAAGATATASFTESNTAQNKAPIVFVFYVNGTEISPQFGPGPLYYAIAGAVGLDSSGNVLGGEQDYNDGNTFISPGEPTTPDVISPTGSSMTVNSTTGTGTLILNVSASNPNVGVKGIETFAVQFINASHALI
ncbi:MAG: hypothetical protein ABSD87_15725, partial [Candidatus Acidiferrales bacterium]